MPGYPSGKTASKSFSHSFVFDSPFACGLFGLESLFVSFRLPDKISRSFARVIATYSRRIFSSCAFCLLNSLMRSRTRLRTSFPESSRTDIPSPISGMYTARSVSFFAAASIKGIAVTGNSSPLDLCTVIRSTASSAATSAAASRTSSSCICCRRSTKSRTVPSFSAANVSAIRKNLRKSASCSSPLCCIASTVSGCSSLLISLQNSGRFRTVPAVSRRCNTETPRRTAAACGSFSATPSFCNKNSHSESLFPLSSETAGSARNSCVSVAS